MRPDNCYQTIINKSSVAGHSIGRPVRDQRTGSIAGEPTRDKVQPKDCRRPILSCDAMNEHTGTGLQQHFVKSIHCRDRNVRGDTLKINHGNVNNRSKSEIGSGNDTGALTDVQDMGDTLLAQYDRTFACHELPLRNAFGDPENAMLHAGLESWVNIQVSPRLDNIGSRVAPSLA